MPESQEGLTVRQTSASANTRRHALSTPSLLCACRHNLAIPNLTVSSSSKRLNTRRNFRSLLDGSSYQVAQHFCHTPGLSDAAPWGERRFSVKDLANRADASFGEMRFKAIEKTPCCRAIIGIDPQPSIDERTDQPSPYRALVIGCIASAQNRRSSAACTRARLAPESEARPE